MEKIQGNKKEEKRLSDISVCNDCAFATFDKFRCRKCKLFQKALAELLSKRAINE